jgi:hypothetical protein
MPDLYKWRVRCATDSKYEFVWTESDAAAPPCPANGAHTVDVHNSSIIDYMKDNEMKVKEESIRTGGNVQVVSMEINALPLSTTVSRRWFDIPISCLSVDFIAVEENRGDSLDVTVGEDTIIGALAGNISALPTPYTAGNYTAGATVSFTHPVFGSRIYTCVVDTTNNESPMSRTHWQHGFAITVSAGVFDITMMGYHIKLNDGTNIDDLGQIVRVDKASNKLYMSGAPTHTFLATTPTYLLQTVYMIKHLVIGQAWNHDLGKSKIGGAYLPADTLVTVHYTNTANTTKKLYSWIELIY